MFSVSVCPEVIPLSGFPPLLLNSNMSYWIQSNQNTDSFIGEGIYVVGFSFPVVPKGKARIRVQISAAHTTEDIDKTVEAFIKIGKQKRVIQ